MKRNSRHRRSKETPDLDVTTFLNLMVVLIPFLLITAVFSRITILELNLPTAASGPVSNKPVITIEVIMRKKGLEIGDGRRVLAAMPKAGDKYDLPKLSEYLQKIKASYSDKEDATILIEPDIEYEQIVQVMDAVRSAEIRKPDQPTPEKLVLFPAISIGDAP